MPGTILRGILEGFGKVLEVSRDFWRVEGFEGVESTTRNIGMSFRPGITRESLPYKLQQSGRFALVVVSTRTPLCLRCQRTGHVRKNCVVPRCNSCRNFCHAIEDCVRTYSTAIAGAADVPYLKEMMDEVEAGATSPVADRRAEGEVMSSDRIPLPGLLRRAVTTLR